MRRRPVAAASARSEPDMPAMMTLPSTPTWASPPAICPTKALARLTRLMVTPLSSSRAPKIIKNGNAIRTKWLTPCQSVVGSVDRGIGVGANHKPTMVELISTIAICTRSKNSAKKTMMTYQSPPIPSGPEAGVGSLGLPSQQPPDQQGNRVNHHQAAADRHRIGKYGQRQAERDRAHDVEVARRLPAEPHDRRQHQQHQDIAKHAHGLLQRSRQQVVYGAHANVIIGTLQHRCAPECRPDHGQPTELLRPGDVDLVGKEIAHEDLQRRGHQHAEHEEQADEGFGQFPPRNASIRPAQIGPDRPGAAERERHQDGHYRDELGGDPHQCPTDRRSQRPSARNSMPLTRVAGMDAPSRSLSATTSAPP